MANNRIYELLKEYNNAALQELGAIIEDVLTDTDIHKYIYGDDDDDDDKGIRRNQKHIILNTIDIRIDIQDKKIELLIKILNCIFYFYLIIKKLKEHFATSNTVLNSAENKLCEFFTKQYIDILNHIDNEIAALNILEENKQNDYFVKQTFKTANITSNITKLYDLIKYCETMDDTIANNYFDETMNKILSILEKIIEKITKEDDLKKKERYKIL